MVAGTQVMDRGGSFIGFCKKDSLLRSSLCATQRIQKFFVAFEPLQPEPKETFATLKQNTTLHETIMT